MTDKPEKRPPAGDHRQPCAEKRREKRYDVPASCREYIALRVKRNGTLVPAALANFSRSGILFESPEQFRQGERTECIIAISLLLARAISFGIEVRYCYAAKGSYITGASIHKISDETWFDVFEEVHDFIATRQGAV